MKKIIAIAMASILAVATLSACGSSASSTTAAAGSDSEIAGLTDQGVLRVGMECDYAPFNWTQADSSDTAVEIAGGSGYADGYDVQIAKQIADELGLELEIYAIEWEGLIPALTSGTIDCIIAGMSPTDERKETIDFSDYYWESSMTLVTRADSEYADATSLADLKGAKLTAQVDSTQYEMLSQVDGAEIEPAMETFSSLSVALIAGTIDGFVCESPAAMATCYANSELTYTEDVGFEFDPVEVSSGVGVRKDSGLAETINGVISKISKETREEMMLDAVERQPLSEE